MLSVTDVHVAYGQTPALNGVSLSVAHGETVSIIGRNGAGKTTLLKTLIGLLPVRTGRIVEAGEDITRRPAHERARRGIGYMPQGRMIFPDLTVEENLLMGADLNRATPGAALAEVLDDFPILRERLGQKGGTLSGGQQQMLALGRALVSRPRLLLLDEPSEGIQPSVVAELQARIAALGRAGELSIVLVEQNIQFAAALADRVYVMEKGRIVTQISPANVMDEQIVREYLAV
jgi:urea transport system ATP-binding protein